MDISYSSSRITERSEGTYGEAIWIVGKRNYTGGFSPPYGYMYFGTLTSRCDNCYDKVYSNKSISNGEDICPVCRQLWSDKNEIGRDIKFMKQRFVEGLKEDSDWGGFFSFWLQIRTNQLKRLETLYRLRANKNSSIRPELMVKMLAYKVLRSHDLTRMLKSFLY